MSTKPTNLKQTPIPVVPMTMKIVNPDGTPTRSGQLLLQQVQPPTTIQGTHADRPDPASASVPDGTLYVESDRSGVLYYNDGGKWYYSSGTMYGTISPDQRPTDLGANDAGFEFRSIDTNPLLGGHHWIWSGGAWIEITAVRYGGHGTRLSQPLADTWNGMIWVETDRSEVIYQNQSGAWHYCSGTMYGTISPDTRPADLGANDAGFQFRTTDSPPRQFLWSGTAWVEVTAIVRYGTHSGRPLVSSVADGFMYVEWDRGGVIYQAEAGVWQYLAGTMWGTLSPDQRPTDLGTHDAGFDFRGTDQQKEFIWSGAAWIDVTPAAANSMQWVSASSPLTLTTTMVDIPGLALTLPKAGTYQISAVIDFNSNDSQALLLAQLVVSGAAQSVLAIYDVFNVPSRATVAQNWMITASGTNTPIKMQANKSAGAGASLAHVHSTLAALWVGP